MNKLHQIDSLTFQGDEMFLAVDGRNYRLSIVDASERLANATEAQRRNFRISPSGYGIHWPELDEDLSVDGLLAQTAQYKQGVEGAVLREDKKDFRK